jgi:two-component system LytT family response regulator
MQTEWRVLIADDEPVARRGVRQLLAGFPAFKVVAECRNGAEVLQALDSAQLDVVFLDIQMPGIDGFDVIRRRTPERMPAVVFLTAYDTFALKAFEAQALDYLVKPVTQARFDATMKRLTRQLSDSKSQLEPRIVVSSSRGVAVVPLREIDWIESADNYARIWTSGKSYLLRESLGDLEKRVKPHGFARAHRKALVRLAGVRELSSTGGELVARLESGASIDVSRRRRAAFSSAVKRAAGSK